LPQRVATRGRGRSLVAPVDTCLRRCGSSRRHGTALGVTTEGKLAARLIGKAFTRRAPAIASSAWK